jgi:hypothetical protein
LTAPETRVSIDSVIRKPTLPVNAILPELLAILQHTTSLVIEAPPGSGKTTRVPPTVLGLVSGEVVVLEPRKDRGSPGAVSSKASASQRSRTSSPHCSLVMLRACPVLRRARGCGFVERTR